MRRSFVTEAVIVSVGMIVSMGVGVLMLEVAEPVVAIGAALIIGRMLARMELRLLNYFS